MKKITALVALVLVVAVIFSSCGSGNSNLSGGYNLPAENNATAKVNQPPHKTEVPAGYIGIYTVEDLKNAGLNKGGNYILMNDLDFSSIEDWESISNVATFDGNNYTVFNLHSTHGGLFDEANRIQNLHIRDCLIDVCFFDSQKDKYVGGIAGSCAYAQNCSATGKIVLDLTKISVNITRDYAVGGLFGYQYSGEGESASFSNCVNHADVEGRILREDIDFFVGGIVGLGSTVEYSKNSGSIELKGEGICSGRWFTWPAAGGIIGYVHMQEGNISYSSNSGEVKTAYYGGGILGVCYEQSQSVALTIDSCYNSGTVSGVKTPSGTATSVGGICGYIGHNKPIRNTTNSKILNCYNTGNILSADYCGAVLGYKFEDDTTQIQYCAYSNFTGVNITGTTAMYADNKAMSLDEMKNLNNYPFNNKESAWKNGSGEYPYPIFKDNI